MKGLITVKDFQKLDFHVGRVSSACRVEGSDKLLLLRVDLGKASDSDEAVLR